MLPPNLPNAHPSGPGFPFRGPAIHYDDAGNPFVQDPAGNLVAYYGQPIPIHPTLVDPMRQMLAIPTDVSAGRPGSFLAIPPQANEVYLGASVGGSASHPATNPEDIPLPGSSITDDDLSDGPTIARAQGYQPVSRIAGSRRKMKGKQNTDLMAPSQTKAKRRATHDPEPTSRKRKAVLDPLDGDLDENAKRGRPRGSGNYLPEDITALLDFVEVELPLGQRGWAAVHRRFNQWRQSNTRPERTLKSLETKYKQLVKTTKPTGDAYCPPDVKRAHHVEQLINERAATRDLSDSEFGGPENGVGAQDTDDDIVEIPPPSDSTTRRAIIRRPDPLQPRRNTRATGMELMSQLTNALDPNVQKARDEDRATRSLQNTQFLAFTQQLRDANVATEALRGQIATLQSRINDAERGRDRAELKLEMMSLTRHHPSPTRHHPSPARDARHFKSNTRTRTRRPRCPSADKRDFDRSGGKMRCVERYPEGGSYTTWVTDNYTDSSEEEIQSGIINLVGNSSIPVAGPSTLPATPARNMPQHPSSQSPHQPHIPPRHRDHASMGKGKSKAKTELDDFANEEEHNEDDEDM
ncbi:hypothetical protein BD779DRAFT_1684723 [Infundibulicybe gibba]|nr:hypothetical protein BD779DRAFT_1684723 [Infundibulicybe gibba]